jgi:V8-like Glu-specific endopeptidase
MFMRLLRRFARTPSRRPLPSAERLDLEPLEARLALSISAVPDTTAFPFRAAVEVEVVNQGQLYSGSGVLLDGRHVLTAAHLLYQGGALDSSVTVYPGRNGQSVTPFGSAQGTDLVVHPSYVSGPAAGTDAYDLGVITLDHDVSAAAGAFGLLPLYPDSTFDSGGTIDILGYPADTFSGVNQYFSTGPAQSADSTDISWALRDVPVQHGSSGSPVYVKSGDTRTVVGIVSELSARTGYATRITPDKYDWIISQLSSRSNAAGQTSAPGSQGPGVFDPTTGTWYLRDSNSPGGPDVTPFAYGAPGWVGVSGDWDGNGSDTVGVVNPATMTWYLKNSNTSGAPDITPFAYGAPGWVPLAGDWDGNGTTTVGAFDPNTATWYLKNDNNPGQPSITPFRYGAPGWVPVVGDWDGNGTVTIGVVDPTTMTWYLRNSNSPGAPDIKPFQYGAPGWVPVAGDWDGNHTTTVGVVDPTTMLWYLRNSNAPGAPDYTPFSYGSPNWQPVVGAWNGLGGRQRSSRAHVVTAAPPAGLDDSPLLGEALVRQADHEELPAAWQTVAGGPGEQSGRQGRGQASAEAPAEGEGQADGVSERWDDRQPFRPFGEA